MRLTKGPLPTLALFIGLPLLLAGGLLVYASSAGVIAVDVREKGPNGDDISLRIPVWLVAPALDLLPGSAARFGAGDFGAPDGRDRWLPVVDAAMGEIERCPDAVLVRVDSPREKVRIEKKNGVIIIEVDDAGDHVRVAVPTGMARKFARFAARVSDRSGRCGRTPSVHVDI